MARASWLLLLLLLLCTPALARADVEPPPRPTVFLVIDSPLLAEQAAVVKGGLGAALARMPRSWSLSLVNGCLQGSAGYQVSEAQAASEASQILELLESGASCRGHFPSALWAPIRRWSGSAARPRHHLVALSSEPPSATRLGSLVDQAVRQGFTVSFISLQKVAAAQRRDLIRRGAGRVHEVAPGPRLLAALRRELGWSRLSKGEEQTLARAVKAQESSRSARLRAELARLEKGAGLKILGSLGGGDPSRIANVLGGGSGSGGVVGGMDGLAGIGTRGSGGQGGPGLGGGSASIYRPRNSRLRRSESLLGSRLALTFRQLRCATSCDLAETRRQLLASARPLLQCLEAANLSLSGRDEVSVEFAAGRISSAQPAASACVKSWVSQAAGGVAATLLVSRVESVE